MFWGRKSNILAAKKREAEQDQKILDGQTALLSAAANTSLVAHELTTILKDKLSDSNKKFDTTAGILHDALIICTPEGNILFSNAIAENVFGVKLFNKNFKDFLCPNKCDIDLWSLLTQARIHGLCSKNKCHDLDIKSEQLVWSDETRSIFIVIRDPFFKAVNNVHDDGCQYPDIN